MLYEDEMEFIQDGKIILQTKKKGLFLKMPEINKTYKAVKYLLMINNIFII